MSSIIYLSLQIILPFVKSYGDNSNVTLSPGKILIKFIRNLPLMWASELSNTGVVLQSGTNMEYTLEWEWPYDSGNDALDTAIGSAEDLSHIITINLYLEQIKE